VILILQQETLPAIAIKIILEMIVASQFALDILMPYAVTKVIAVILMEFPNASVLFLDTLEVFVKLILHLLLSTILLILLLLYFYTVLVFQNVSIMVLVIDLLENVNATVIIKEYLARKEIVLQIVLTEETVLV
jgi:hypothetical protein